MRADRRTQAHPANESAGWAACPSAVLYHATSTCILFQRGQEATSFRPFLRCASRYIFLFLKPILTAYVCRTAGAEEDYGEEEAADEQPEEESKEPTESETEQQRQMRLIAEQKKAQEEALRKAREQAAEAVEESKEEGVTDATKIAVADEFDIDDI